MFFFFIGRFGAVFGGGVGRLRIRFFEGEFIDFAGVRDFFGDLGGKNYVYNDVTMFFVFYGVDVVSTGRVRSFSGK